MGLLANQVPLLINHVGSSIVQILVGASGPFLFANASILGLGVSVSLICFKVCEVKWSGLFCSKHGINMLALKVLQDFATAVRRVFMNVIASDNNMDNLK